MRSYYRVFYWMYSLSLKTNAFRDNKPMSAFISAFMFSYFLVMDLAIIETSLKYFGIDVRQFYERIVFHIVSGCILTVNLFVFLYKKRYLTIEERFQDEDKRTSIGILNMNMSLLIINTYPLLNLIINIITDSKQTESKDNMTVMS